MTCPICDQKPANCDCTDRERRVYRELNDVEELRLTDEEREAIEVAVEYAEEFNTENAIVSATILRSLLARHRAT